MKLKSFLIPLLTTTLAMSGVTFGLTACSKGGDTPQPEPEPEEVKFNVVFNGDTDYINPSSIVAYVGKQYTVYLNPHSNHIIKSIDIKNGDGPLSTDDYNFEESANKLTVFASAITSETLIITVTTQYVPGHEAIIHADADYGILLNKTLVHGYDYTSKVLVSDSTKTIASVIAKVNNVQIPSTYDAETQVITVNKENLDPNYNLDIYVTTEPKSHYQYIYERTFSILGRAKVTISMTDQQGNRVQATGSGGAYGTAWIIDDATPDIEGDYNYYIGTNFHVTHGIDTSNLSTYEYMCEYFGKRGYYNFEYVSATYNYAIADGSLADPSTGICDSSVYLPITGVEKQPETCFLFNDEVVTTKNYYPCIDFYVYKANLQTSSSDIGIKLDTLNLQKKDFGYITKFVAGDNENIIDKDKYIGGYPVREGESIKGGRWTTHKMELYGKTDYTKGDSNHSHTIGDDGDDFGRIDIGAGTQYGNTYEPQWMGGGASGSMILTKDYEIAGIYWGHWGEGSDYMPAVTFLISEAPGDEYNFVSAFLTE